MRTNILLNPRVAYLLTACVNHTERTFLKQNNLESLKKIPAGALLLTPSLLNPKGPGGAPGTPFLNALARSDIDILPSPLRTTVLEASSPPGMELFRLH